MSLNDNIIVLSNDEDDDDENIIPESDNEVPESDNEVIDSEEEIVGHDQEYQYPPNLGNVVLPEDEHDESSSERDSNQELPGDEDETLSASDGESPLAASTQRNPEDRASSPLPRRLGDGEVQPLVQELIRNNDLLRSAHEEMLRRLNNEETNSSDSEDSQPREGETNQQDDDNADEAPPSAADMSFADFQTQRRSERSEEKKKKNEEDKKETTVAVEASNKVADGDDDENDGKTCTICFDQWTSNGKHRLCSLKCGHLFGFECIDKWLKSSHNKICPQCNAKNRRSDIRVLYANKLIAVDTTDLEQAKKELNKEQTLRRQKDIELAKISMEKSILAEENRRLKLKIERLSTLGGGSCGARKRAYDCDDDETARKRPLVEGEARQQYKQVGELKLPPGCRLVDFDKNFHQFAVTSPSTCPLFTGHGITRVQSELRSNRFYWLHSQQVKDIKFAPHSHSRLLSAGQEGSIKYTDLNSNSTVVEYKTSRPCWSCCWNEADANYIYAGLSNHTYLQFDLRNTTEPLSTFQPQDQATCPIISLHHVPTSDSTATPGGNNFPGASSALLSCTLNGVIMWREEQRGQLMHDYKPTLFPNNGACADLQYDPASKHCLITFRPGRQAPRRTSHVLCSLTTCHVTGKFDFHTVDTFYGGEQHRSLTRNSLFTTATGALLTATIDEARDTVRIYDVTKSDELQLIKTKSRPLDCRPITFDSDETNKNFVVLTENSLNLYQAN